MEVGVSSKRDRETKGNHLDSKCSKIVTGRTKRMKVGDLVRGKLWEELGIVVCVPPMPSMIEVCWTGEKPRRQKHLSGELERLNESR